MTQKRLFFRSFVSWADYPEANWAITRIKLDKKLLHFNFVKNRSLSIFFNEVKFDQKSVPRKIRIFLCITWRRAILSDHILEKFNQAELRLIVFFKNEDLINMLASK